MIVCGRTLRSMNSFSLPKLSHIRLLLTAYCSDMAEPESMVFVVDDDPSICRSIERLIEPAGFKVQSFRSAAQFLAQGRPSSPACLVLDVRLPGLSGLDLQ